MRNRREGLGREREGSAAKGEEVGGGGGHYDRIEGETTNRGDGGGGVTTIEPKERLQTGRGGGVTTIEPKERLQTDRRVNGMCGDAEDSGNEKRTREEGDRGVSSLICKPRHLRTVNLKGSGWRGSRMSGGRGGGGEQTLRYKTGRGGGGAVPRIQHEREAGEREKRGEW